MRRWTGICSIAIGVAILSDPGGATAQASSKMSADEVVAFVQSLQSKRTMRLTKDAPKVSIQQMRQAANGDYVAGVRIVDGVAAGQGYGVAVYDLPIAQLWKAVIDEPHFPGHIPVEQSFVIDGVARTSPRSLFQYLDLPLVSDRWWVTRMRHNAKLFTATDGVVWELSWKDATHTTKVQGTRAARFVTEGVPVAWTHGAWLLVGLPDGRTYTEYYVWSDPGGMVPAGPASRFASGKVTETLEGMEAFARKHIPKCSAQFKRPDGNPMP